jgi:hypothetical protein
VAQTHALPASKALGQCRRENETDDSAPTGRRGQGRQALLNATGQAADALIPRAAGPATNQTKRTMQKLLRTKQTRESEAHHDLAACLARRIERCSSDRKARIEPSLVSVAPLSVSITASFVGENPDEKRRDQGAFCACSRRAPFAI